MRVSELHGSVGAPVVEMMMLITMVFSPRDYDPERTMGDWRSGPRAVPEPAARARPEREPMRGDRERDRDRDCEYIALSITS